MRLSRKKIIISSIVIIVLMVVIAVVAIIKLDTIKPKNMLKILQDSVDLQIKGFVYTEVGNSNAKWEVKADTATYDKTKNLVALDKVYIKLTTSDDRTYEMTADKGQMETEKKIIEIIGNVVITSDQGDRFLTDRLNYNDSEKKFYTDAPVIMQNKQMRITGKGMSLYMDKGELAIPDKVKATIN